jgi:hypothetical protein
MGRGSQKTKEEAVTKTNVVAIPRIETGLFTVTVKGLTPLLCHRFSDTVMEGIAVKQGKKAKNARGARNPEEEYLDSMYMTSDGKAGFPAQGFKKACIQACSFIEDFTKVQARGAFFILGDVLPIEGEPRMHTSVVRLNGKSADLRYRAEFPEWKVQMTIRYNAGVISEEAIMNLLQNAGFAVGVGDWRPEKNGTFGTFTVIH